MNHGWLQSLARTESWNTHQAYNMKHIPTLSLFYFPEHTLYGYEYDDQNGNMQTEYGFTSIGDALGKAFKHLKTFTVMSDVESR
jgi:hypothetical protein